MFTVQQNSINFKITAPLISFDYGGADSTLFLSFGDKRKDVVHELHIKNVSSTVSKSLFTVGTKTLNEKNALLNLDNGSITMRGENYVEPEVKVGKTA